MNNDRNNLNYVIDQLNDRIADIDELILQLPISSDNKNSMYTTLQELADSISDAVELAEHQEI